MSSQAGPFFVGEIGGIGLSHVRERTGSSQPSPLPNRLLEALSLGLGVAFLIFGLPLVRQIESSWRLRAWLMYLSVGWLMVS